ncbi:MAG: nitroreductase family protein [Candidatus Bathyarchaeia archaeon]
MTVMEVIRKRRSIRKYKPSELPKEHLLDILEAGRLAPSAGNRQPWKFIVVREPEQKRKLAEAARGQMFIADAAAVIVALADPEASPRWCDKDVMIAVENMVLAAAELGYGSCYIGAFEEEGVKNLLKIPGGLRVVVLLPIGVPDEAPSQRPRKTLDEVFFGEEYGKPLGL